MIEILKRDYGLLQKLLLTAISRGLAAIGTLVFNFVLARYMGANDYGQFMLSYTMLTGFSIMSRFGMPMAVLRFASILYANSSYQAFREHLLKVSVLSFGLSIVLASVFILGSGILSQIFYGSLDYKEIIVVMAITMPFHAFLVVQSAYFKAMGKSEIAPFFEVGLMVFVAASSVFLYSEFFRVEVTAWIASGFLLVSSVLVFLLGQITLRKLVRVVSTDIVPLDMKPFMRSLPDYAVASMTIYLIQFAPTLILGLFVDGKQLALYALANSITFTISFLLWVVEAVTAPKFAQFYHSGKNYDAKRLHYKSIRYMLVFVLPLFGVVVVFAKEILLLFGEDFIAASPAVVIMALGQLLAVIVGPVNFVLNMSGHHRTQRNIEFMSAFATIVSSLVLIPLFGFIGAAVATSFGLMVRNVVGFYRVNRILHQIP